MSHLPLDARAILHYLNELGYRNISAIQLKEFLKDLRKLIKYEERLGVNTQQNDYYESLFRRTTASYRAKIDKENANGTKRKSFDSEKPTTSKQVAIERRKVLGERNYGETSTSSNDVLDSSHPKSLKQTPPRRSKQEQQPHIEKKADQNKIDTKTIKALIEDSITQILREKYCQEFVQRGNEKAKSPKEKTPIKSVVEEVVKEKLSELRHSTKERSHTGEQGSLRSVVEDIVNQVLQEKLSNVQKSKDKDESIKNLSQDLQQKLNVAKDLSKNLQREPITHYNTNKLLDSQALVQELLAEDDCSNQAKNKISTNKDKENSSAGCIKRLQRTQKKPEWQDPRPNDVVLDKPKRNVRSHSPAPSSTARSGRCKSSSSVLIRRSVSQGRHNKPKSDPVALYQYYKNEWEHFRKQIPGETSHSRLRWHVRQRLLDPE